MPVRGKSANPWPILQFEMPPMHRKIWYSTLPHRQPLPTHPSLTNPPINPQSTNHEPICQSSPPPHIHQNWIATNWQWIGTHWHMWWQSFVNRKTKAASNLGTSQLYGPTISLYGGRFHTPFKYSTNLPIRCNSRTILLIHRQSWTNLPIHHHSISYIPILDQSSNSLSNH